MKDNQTIDGVSRKSLEQALKLAAVFDDGGDGSDVESARGVVWILRALLDAPALELIEPVAPWFYFVECDDPDYSGLFNHENEAQTQANDHGGSVVKLWNVPPTYKPAPRPHGVPVAYADPLAFSNFKAHAHRGSPYDHEWMWAKPAHAGMVPLYAEQPALVAVVMQERLPGDDGVCTESHYASGWNACLDELKRLNPSL